MMYLIIACIVSGVASLAVGAIWYSSALFGNAWMAETGLTKEDAAKANMPVIFGVSFIVCAYLAYEMKWMNHDDALPSFVHGMFHGVKHAGIFAVGAIIVNGLFEHKGPKYLLINGGYWLVVFALIGGIIAVFPPFTEKKAETEAETEAETTGMRFELIEMQEVELTAELPKDVYIYRG